MAGHSLDKILGTNGLVRYVMLRIARARRWVYFDAKCGMNCCFNLS